MRDFEKTFEKIIVIKKISQNFMQTLKKFNNFGKMLRQPVNFSRKLSNDGENSYQIRENFKY